ncbi:archaea-specific SMC-related protein [Haloplanus aerogenes]|uniref:AAA domain-containing protein n=1 Tax=Haloplanus aerogenes TaxID=660522 RepID=A0A3M0DZE6_9EURY|nr:archaea-specific SMC-related protein [Haloplanus aerogenes]AZH25346.1 chromosome segregation protein SMC [Haloplanus aerogenes]RMB25043.1 AAA domain-containing protein [Haloplanus aerogenes]
MAEKRVAESTVRVTAENVGGIDETRVEFTPGVTILSGRNATNRTSLLLAIMAALGSDAQPLKADAESGRVELHVEGERFTRTLDRQGDHVVTGGDPYLDDSELADLFAFLLERNEARQAVQRGDDLRELIMRPVDTEEIQRRIDRAVEEKGEIERELDDLDALAEEKTRLVQKRSRLDADIEEKREEREETVAEIEATDADIEEKREEKAELEERLSDLQSVRSKLEDVRYSLETQRESLASLREERDEIDAELDGGTETAASEIEEIRQRIERLRGRKETLDANVNELQSILQFNEEMLDEDGSDLLESPTDDESVTDRLRGDGRTVTCWTCGSDVQARQIEETLDRLRDLRQEKFQERNELAAEIDDLEAERQEYERERQRQEKLERERQRVGDEIDRRERRVASLADDRDDLQDRIETLEAEVERLQDDSYGEILDLHKEANQLEFELDRLEDELAEVDTRIEEIDDRLDDRDDLEARRDELRATLEDLRTRVDHIEQGAAEAFNTHMANVLDRLEYGNIERIWLERTQTEVRDGRQKVTKSVFDLHIVRTTESGVTYEDTVDHLSESEREVTGLVFALAGYLVHDVHETVPFMLLDSLEAIDSDRIAAVVEYLESYADNLVVALLPEDAAALSDSYQRINDI